MNSEMVDLDTQLGYPLLFPCQICISCEFRSHANCVNGYDCLQSATKMLSGNNAGINISQMLLFVEEENKKDLAENECCMVTAKHR